MGDLGDFFAGIVSICVLAALGRWLLGMSKTHAGTLPLQLRLFSIALGIRFALALFLYQLGVIDALGDYDSIGWLFGQTLQLDWASRNYSVLDVVAAWRGAFDVNAAPQLGISHHVGYYYLLGTVFFFIGIASKMVAATLNCFLGALTVVFAYRTARTLFSEGVAVRVGWWTCLFPSMIIWSAQTLKEPVVILLEVVALYSCVQLKRSRYAVRYVVLCGLCIVFMMPFRFYAAYIGMAAVVVTMLSPMVKQQTTSRGSAFGFLAFLVVLVVMGSVLASGEARLDQFDLDFIQKFRADIAAGTGSAVEYTFDMTTTTGFGLGTLVGAAHLLLAPFPWQLGIGLRTLVTAPELFYWWWLFFVGVVPGVRYALRHRFADMLPVLVFIVGLGLLYSMIFGNVGVVFRQRAQLLPWLLIFAGVGLEQRDLRLVKMRRFDYAPRSTPGAGGGIVSRPSAVGPPFPG